jgi:hypothetical protein
MRKFTQKKQTTTTKKKSDSLINLINENLQINVDGKLDEFLEKDINIDGKKKLANTMEEYLMREKYKVLESVKYRGISQTEKLLKNKEL